MTTFEHAMLGTTGALAAGLHHRSWQLVAVAGVAAVLPDWDGLSILFGAAAFDQIHRAIGHSLFIATLLSAAAGCIEYRLRTLARLARWLSKWVEGLPTRSLDADNTDGSKSDLLLWTATAILATWSHLAADLVFSGHAHLSDWGLKLFWPISQRSYVFPIIRWGDPVPTIVLIAGMFAMLRWRARVHFVAALTLFALVGYIALRASWLPYA